MIFNNNIKPNQFIGALAFVLGVAFTCVVLKEGCVHNWVCYWAGVFSLLFIIGAPACIQDLVWGKVVLLASYLLFAAYNIYNVTVCIVEGNNDAYVSIPIATSSILIVFYMATHDHYIVPHNINMKSFSFYHLFVAINILNWGWLFVEGISETLRNELQAFFIAFTIFQFILLLVSAGMLLRKNMFRIILSLMVSFQYVIYIGLYIGNKIIEDIWLVLLMTVLSLLEILCLHSRCIIDEIKSGSYSSKSTTTIM